MKTTFSFGIALLLAPMVSATVFAHDKIPDRAAQLLARDGTVRLAAAGPYVEIGTYRVQVVVKLGPPTAKLSDGTWLYQDRAVEGSSARGALAIRFVDGRVSSLAFVDPAIAMAMLNAPQTSEHVYAANAR